MPFSLTQYGPALGAKEMFPSDDKNHISGDPTDSVYLGLGFAGRLECVPHDNVHGLEQNVPSVAGDPTWLQQTITRPASATSLGIRRKRRIVSSFGIA
jgi:hypothetical protein